eukprot:TRINITY_DN32735_c0_g1_i1.p1 TRINITY_DN32735_c0_g1~~TRINITY_DN32735_c0_g1_i1.p1  ORF type:complete len:196 (+),score=54.29 TRINITY_DN32735_c0_g1_i1:60-647(+)
MCVVLIFFLMIRRPPRSTLSSSSAASDVYKRQVSTQSTGGGAKKGGHNPARPRGPPNRVVITDKATDEEGRRVYNTRRASPNMNSTKARSRSSVAIRMAALADTSSRRPPPPTRSLIVNVSDASAAVVLCIPNDPSILYSRLGRNMHMSDIVRCILLSVQAQQLSLIHISEPTRLLSISYAVFCLKKKITTTPHY